MNAPEFVSRYIARFGPFPADVRDEWQMKEWAPIVGAVPADKCGQVLDAVGAARGRAKYLPRIADFRDALAALSVNVYQPAVNDCLYCSGGNLPVLCRKVDGKVFLTDAGPDLHIRYFPCHCAAGKNVGANLRATECLDWVVAKCKEWGILDTFHADGIKLAERWLWACLDRIPSNYKMTHAKTEEPAAVYDAERPDEIPF